MKPLIRIMSYPGRLLSTGLTQRERTRESPHLLVVLGGFTRPTQDPRLATPGRNRSRRIWFAPYVCRGVYAALGSPAMGCFIPLLAIISPRLALFAIFLFSNLLSRSFDSWVLPLVGFFLLPWTTL